VRPEAVQWTEIRSGCKKTSTRREDHRLRWPVLAFISAALMTACGGSDDTPMPPLDPAPPAAIDVPYTNGAATTANPVAYWNKIGTDTINVAATPGTGTPEEQRPGGAVDLATLHIAIYDAVMAIVGTHEPFATTPTGTNRRRIAGGRGRGRRLRRAERVVPEPVRAVSGRVRQPSRRAGRRRRKDTGTGDRSGSRDQDARAARE